MTNACSLSPILCNRIVATSFADATAYIMPPDYSSVEYWDSKYGESEEDFDWYFGLEPLKPYVLPLIENPCKVLVVGCGNSGMCPCHVGRGCGREFVILFDSIPFLCYILSLLNRGEWPFFFLKWKNVLTCPQLWQGAGMLGVQDVWMAVERIADPAGGSLHLVV